LVDYFGLIVIVSLLECIIPRRPASDSLRLRWASNIGITVLNTILIRSLFPVLTTGVAIMTAQHDWGLFRRLHLPLWAELVFAIIVFDLVTYTQHYLSHRIPVLWRIHRAHHTDQDFDFTTGLRFHPLEAILTTVVDLAAIVVVGALPAAVLIRQLVMLSQDLLEHGNFRIPSRWDRAIRLVFVTSNMHRIHHSEDVLESGRNLANTFSWWDRLFNTYAQSPQVIPERMSFGLAEFRDRKHLTLPWMLAQPFLQETPATPRKTLGSNVSVKHVVAD